MSDLPYKGMTDRHVSIQSDIDYYNDRHLVIEGHHTKDHLTYSPSDGKREVFRLESYYRRKLKHEQWQDDMIDNLIDQILYHH